LVQEIEKIGAIVEVNARAQSALLKTNRQFVDRFTASRSFGADPELDSLFDEPC